ncbi:leucine-rich repeat-containing protein 52-like isoform X1 [Schistocerca nitens]|uniref:leucine-rich repeat-containing protein 52-like isoform X1 n=2 Tax=Schistocerca nitens TaxID=7011 RepID=UPI002117EA94|nr:leucine-rich repeat-containing protein 52-like isoform X1 [Schistocerca nitens]
MFMIFGFLVLFPWISGGTTMNMNMSCGWYPSLDYERVAMECSGPLVTKVPTMLSSDLKLLRLTGTNITSLDSTSFEGRSLAELTTLSVSGGALARVAANAFCPLPALAKLDLSHNQLDLLDALSFKCNKHLRTVNLSDNPSLHHLPLLVSSSIETVYIENCSLTSVDVAVVKRMTALKTLSLSGNRNLHCLSEKKRLEEALPDLSVICEHSVEYRPSQPTTGGRESPPLNFHNNTQSTIHPTRNDVGNSASQLPQSAWTITVVAVSVFTVIGVPV